MVERDGYVSVGREVTTDSRPVHLGNSHPIITREKPWIICGCFECSSGGDFGRGWLTYRVIIGNPMWRWRRCCSTSTYQAKTVRRVYRTCVSEIKTYTLNKCFDRYSVKTFGKTIMMLGSTRPWGYTCRNSFKLRNLKGSGDRFGFKEDPRDTTTFRLSYIREYFCSKVADNVDKLMYSWDQGTTKVRE